MNRFSAVSLFLMAALPLLNSGCPTAPEQCRGCLPALADGGGLRPPDGSAGDGGGKGGGAGSGLIVGTGGSGGLDTGGAGGTAIGGMAGTSATGGISATGGNTTGGNGTGGAGTGGSGTGGAATGGQGTGGQGTGGGQGGGGATGGQGGGGGGIGTDPDLVLWYRFDESTGNTAADSATAAGAPRNGTLATMGSGATATWSIMPQVGTHALRLTPASTSPNSNGAYVTVPASIQSLAPGAVTIALWVNLAAATPTQNWERIFDFGLSATAMNNIYMTARAGDPSTTPLRFVITNSGHAVTSEQRLEAPGTPLTANAWHHIAVVLPVGSSPYTGTLYLDGTSVATNRTMTVHPGDLGATTNNWLGRSQTSADPYFRGLMDDFRIYRRALNSTEISALFTAR